ncbi:MAG: GNAT family N-acetyltransferase [Flavobacteriales bacterium]|nr:GNAT family N-acetyltransferase [Flavobacteriales bacterium]|tara:strand:+ start:6626 stop:7096 length:471 start_codon:yes stop_codon:yes gene_type:complete
MKILIRKGIKKDLPQVLSLIKELAKFENAEHEVTISIDDLKKDGFGKNPFFQFIVAVVDEKIIGLSFYFIRYSTWKGKFLFLEDLIVTEKFRNQGIGSKLFEETIKICKSESMNGMFWQVLDWNKSAIKFYKKYNSNISGEWLNGKLTKNDIEKIN